MACARRSPRVTKLRQRAPTLILVRLVANPFRKPWPGRLRRAILLTVCAAPTIAFRDDRQIVDAVRSGRAFGQNRASLVWNDAFLHAVSSAKFIGDLDA
jgi:hypothetical protein